MGRFCVRRRRALPVSDLLELKVRHLKVTGFFQGHEDVDEPVSDHFHLGLALFLGTAVEDHSRAVPRRIVILTLQNTSTKSLLSYTSSI